MSQGNILIMLIMLGLILVLPIAFLIMPKNSKRTVSYLAGANTEGGTQFLGSLGVKHEVSNRNYYLTGFFSEVVVSRLAIGISIFFICAMFLAVIL